MRRLTALIAGLLALWSAAAAADDLPPALTGLAIRGEVKYKPGFQHFDYVNPDAPKGGDVRQADIGTFDSLNPFIVQGTPAPEAALLFDTLLTPSFDEPFSMYPLIAESVQIAPDRSWEIFNLDPRARFWDGSPITAADVVFSLNILKTQGLPQYRAYYNLVQRAEALDPRRVRFVFSSNQSRELPLILGQLPVLSAAYWKTRDFAASTLDPPLGNGPYRIESVDPGRAVVLARVKDYWARDLPAMKGTNNFDHIRVDYYRDDNVALQAFKAGQYDIRPEVNSKLWATGYDSPAKADGRIVMGDFPNKRPAGMEAFAFNIRRPVFADARLRRAIIGAFDFEWSNKTLFYGQYKRDTSYFTNSEFAATGLPGPAELALLDPLRGQVPDEVFTTPPTLPVSDGSGEDRDNLRASAALLRAAGYRVQGGRLVDPSGSPVAFEMLLDNPAFERVALPLKANLAKLGIDMSVRTVDAAQYKLRTDHYDYDMIVEAWGESESPGNEQRDFWGSAAADQPGSMNAVGIKSKAVDALVEDIVAASDHDALVAACRALDRVLLWSDYVIPGWYQDSDHVAYWNKFGIPAVIPYQGVQTNAWWVDPVKAAALAGRQGN